MNVQANVHECSSNATEGVEQSMRLLAPKLRKTLVACHSEKLLFNSQKLTLIAATFDAINTPVFIEKWGEDKRQLCLF